MDRKRENEVLIPLLLTFGVLVVLAISGYFVVKHLNLRQRLANFGANRVYEVKKPPEGAVLPGEPIVSIDLNQIQALRGMLRDGQYTQLNSVLEGYQNAFEIDQTDEYRVYDAFNAFRLTDPGFESRLMAWKAATPDAYPPYVALGEYYSQNGWARRGAKFASETSREQFDQMALYFEKAEENLKAALDINPNLMTAYIELITICNAGDCSSTEDDYIAQSFELFPHSYLIRLTGSWAREPRWGGSYSQMEKIADEARVNASVNPKLWLLYGKIPYDQAMRQKKAKNFEKALELLDKALLYGDDWGIHLAKAKIYYYNMKDFDKALAAVEKSLALRPEMKDSCLARSRILFALKDYAAALKDANTAEAIRPGDEEVQKWRAWASGRLISEMTKNRKGKIEEYLKFSLLARDFDSSNYEPYYWLGLVYKGLHDDESAIRNLATAIELNPRHYLSYVNMDGLLAKREQWERTIGYWDAFLEQEPDNADAYEKRAITYYNNGNYEKSVLDMKKACELENDARCDRLNKVKP